MSTNEKTIELPFVNTVIELRSDRARLARDANLLFVGPIRNFSAVLPKSSPSAVGTAARLDVNISSGHTSCVATGIGELFSALFTHLKLLFTARTFCCKFSEAG